MQISHAVCWGVFCKAPRANSYKVFHISFYLLEVKHLHSLRSQAPSTYTCIGSVMRVHLFLALADLSVQVSRYI